MPVVRSSVIVSRYARRRERWTSIWWSLARISARARLGRSSVGAAASEIRLLSWASSFASSVLSFLVSCRLSGTVRRSALAHFRW